MDSPARIVDEHLVLCVNHLLRKQSKQPDGVCVGGEGSAYRPAMQHLSWHKLWAKSVASKVFRLAIVKTPEALYLQGLRGFVFSSNRGFVLLIKSENASVTM